MNDTSGTAVCRTLHTRRPPGSTDFSIEGNANDGDEPGSGSFERSTVGTMDTRLATYDTIAGDESGMARPVRPRGMTLNDTRAACRRYVRVTCWSDADVTA